MSRSPNPLKKRANKDRQNLKYLKLTVRKSYSIEISPSYLFAKMTTHFITAEIDLQETPLQLRQEIDAELQKRGEPLRWAVTRVDTERQKAQVEAIVTVESDSTTSL